MTPQQEERLFQLFCAFSVNTQSAPDQALALYNAATAIFAYEEFKERVFAEVSKRASEYTGEN